ncbi:MAG TPA: phosphatase domain-containing protein [Roseiflexaceae bacterium]
MSRLRQALGRIAGAAGGRVDRLKYRLDRRSGDERIQIAAYRGYGTAEQLYLKGRVLEDKGIRTASDDDSIWDNLANMYRRFESDEIPGARVLARLGDVEQEVVANKEGFFEVRIAPAHPLPADPIWHEVDLELLSPRRAGRDAPRTVGQVLLPPPGARFGVISDLDDTVIQTDVTRVIRMVRNTLLGNARTRHPFPGVAALYRALHSSAGAPANPLFYVSSSPWNLYDMLDDFFRLRSIPEGPIFLRDWGLSSKDRSSSGYKLAVIRQILDRFPALPFLLLGDSGEHDPEIYREIVRLYPGRILAIYIRNVKRRDERIAAVQALAEEVAAAGSALVLADDTLVAARHAAEHGWIDRADLDAVAAAVAAEQTPAAQAEPPTEVIAGPQAVAQGAVAETLAAGAGAGEPLPNVIVEGDDSARENAQ